MISSGGQSDLEIYLTKSTVLLLASKNAQVGVENTNRRIYLSTSKKVIGNQTT